MVAWGTIGERIRITGNCRIKTWYNKINIAIHIHVLCTSKSIPGGSLVDLIDADAKETLLYTVRMKVKYTVNNLFLLLKHCLLLKSTYPFFLSVAFGGYFVTLCPRACRSP